MKYAGRLASIAVISVLKDTVSINCKDYAKARHVRTIFVMIALSQDRTAAISVLRAIHLTARMADARIQFAS